MLSTMPPHERKGDSSMNGERKSSLPIATLHCCRGQNRSQQRRWRQGMSGCVSSGALLLLLPKCPLCLAAYLAVWMGAGAGVSVAAHLRPMLAVLFLASMMLLLVRYVAVRARHKSHMHPVP